MTDLEKARLSAVFREDSTVGSNWSAALIHTYFVMKGLSERGWRTDEKLRALQELTHDMFVQFETTMRETADE